MNSTTTARPPQGRHDDHRQRHDQHWGALAVLAAATVLTALVGGLAATDAPSFYASLALPSWAPPASVFGPVWTLLYLMMCVAAWLVVREQGVDAAKPAMQLYATQLVLNAAWSWLFFRWQVGSLAFFDVIALLAVVAITTRAFWRRQPSAGWLMLPYVAWVAFATALTFAVWQMNQNVL